MKLRLFALLLPFASVALPQSGGPASSHFEQGWKGPTLLAQPRDFSKLAPEWKLAPEGRIMNPGFMLATPSDLIIQDPQFDAAMIVHPPLESLGEQQPGALVAENIYPNLRCMPIGAPGIQASPIPTAWSNPVLKKIPTDFPKLAMLPVGKLAAAPAH